jgi:hypothetical protein
MKKIFFIGFILAISFLSCKNKTTNPTSENIITEKKTVIEPQIIVEEMSPALGSYVGSFGDNKITVLITKATADSIRGRSIVGGNDRPFEGTLKNEKITIEMSAKEPGDDKNDGVFKFS